MFVVMALVMTAVFLGGMRSVVSGGWRDAGRPLIADYIDRLAAEIGTPPDAARAKALTERLPLAVRIEGPVVNWESHPGRMQGRGFEARAGNFFSRTTADGHRISFGLGSLPWQRGPHAVGWLTLGVLLLLVLAAYALVRRLLRPLDDIGAGAQRFGRGDFDKPIPIRRNDELGDLAQRINTMAHDISDMLDAKRALLLALSHELRSPLTRARLNAELLPATAEGATEREALLRDLGEMRDLISDLLESERLASPHAALLREHIDLATLVHDVVAELPHEDEVELDLPPDIPLMSLDRTRMRLMLRNLLDNALRHGGASAGALQSPRLSLRRVEGAVEIEVRDFGPGVDDAQIEHLAEPFFRTDSARQRATGGVGLGMYLCKLVALAHGGSFELRNARPGLSVRVALSLAQPPDGDAPATIRARAPRPHGDVA
ncbi:MAG: HAMP domain-containing protein [Proteobacteria bacterium]|nr:HAMP domain-containing protein [Pseudomonadota bacterium]